MRTLHVRYIVYDLDGLLLATEQIYTEVMRTVLQRYGRTLDWSLKAQLIGRRAMDSARRTVIALDLPITAEAYLAERNHLLGQRFPEAEPKPGAREMVHHFHRHGIGQAVATSSSRELFGIKAMRHQDWFCLFDHVVSAEDPDVENGKPAPDVFLVAADRLGAKPSECLVFEDSPAGVTAAVAAGMSVIAVPEPEMDRDQFAAADEILDSLQAFEPAKWGLPA